VSRSAERTYWETRLGESYTLEGVGYVGLGRSFNSWMYRVRSTLARRRLQSLLPERRSLSVLDVGSGTGFYIDLWRRLGVRSVTGSDLTETAVHELRWRFPAEEFSRLDIGADRLPLEGRRFDVVSAFDVLFHIVDDEAYRRSFQNIAGVLRPGGTLVFTDNFVHRAPARSSTQASRRLTDIEATVRAAGFEVVYRRPAFVLMNAPVDSESTLHRRWWGLLTRAVSTSDVIGSLAGALLFPIEVALCSLLREGPSTEMMVCRRIESTGGNGVL